ncbi:MAG: NAD(P)-binding protein [Deltaproteobacteria bacterium]|nr:NAD(P)-binding protein [Deltaproteobacteria bacterium]
MSSEKIIVIGGNAAGMTAAARAARLNKDLEIKIFEKGPHISYAP